MPWAPANPPCPNTSEVLREAGLVSSRVAAQQRIYRLDLGPLRSLDGWLQPYRRLWTQHLDALEQHLDRNAGRAEK